MEGDRESGAGFLDRRDQFFHHPALGERGKVVCRDFFEVGCEGPEGRKTRHLCGPFEAMGGGAEVFFAAFPRQLFQVVDIVVESPERMIAGWLDC